ncbi:hypothetical protein [Chitinophaga sp.]|uniref:hypothetical protein n=1 Tax=Chitinophaga sp. TaxID=1869181 RepID=UPI0031D818ED
MTFYVVKYTGPFGFIKPWTAVRDSKTFSQQFLTASTLEGIEKKLFPEQLKEIGIKKIARYRLSYDSINLQQEVTQTRGWEYKKQQSLMVRNRSILDRGVMLSPMLMLAFSDRQDAETAAEQHICLCRNEDILLPEPEILLFEEEEFNDICGFELIFGETDDSFLTGFNRFDNNMTMHGRLIVIGRPVKNC